MSYVSRAAVPLSRTRLVYAVVLGAGLRFLRSTATHTHTRIHAASEIRARGSRRVRRALAPPSFLPAVCVCVAVCELDALLAACVHTLSLSLSLWLSHVELTPGPYVQPIGPLGFPCTCAFRGRQRCDKPSQTSLSRFRPINPSSVGARQVSILGPALLQPQPQHRLDLQRC